MPYTAPRWIYPVVTIAVCIFTYMRGDREVRIASVYCSVMCSICAVLPHSLWLNWWAPSIWQFLDVPFFFALAWRSSRYWTLAMASVSLLNFVTTTAQIWTPFASWAIGTAQVVWIVVYLTTLVAGAWATPHPTKGVVARTSPVQSA